MTPPYLSKTRSLDAVRAMSYGRQSKQREDESRTSPEGQRKATADLVSAKGWTFVRHFEDVGRSGFDPKIIRPGFEALMAAVWAHECDVVVVPALSRLTRQGAFEAMKINDVLQEHGVSLVSVDEPFLDTSSPIGVAIFALIAGLAQQESESKRQHMLRAQAAVRQVGGHVTGSAPYGFVSERATVAIADGGTMTITRLIPDPVTSEVVRSMIADALEGKTSNAIAQRLNAERVPTSLESQGTTGANRLKGRRDRPDYVSKGLDDGRAQWHSGSVYRVLRDPRLAGFASKVIGGGGKREPQRDAAGEILRSHEGIITPGEWFALQDVVNGRRPEVRQNPNSPTLLSGWGIAFCADCGSTMQAGTSKGLRYYRCRRPAGTIEGHVKTTARMTLVDDLVASRVIGRLETLFDEPDDDDLNLLAEVGRRFVKQQDRSGTEAQRAELTAALAYTRQALATLYEDREAGAYGGQVGTRVFRDSAERLGQEEARLSSELEALEATATNSVRLPVDGWTAENGDPIGEGSPWSRWDLTRRREFLSLFIDRVEIGKPLAYGRASKMEDRVRIIWATGGEL